MSIDEEKKSTPPPESPKEEKDKNNALFAGVIFFMILIVVLWIMNLGMVFKGVPARQSSQVNINKLSQDFQNAFNEAGTKINELKKIDESELQKYQAQIPAATSSIKN